MIDQHPPEARGPWAAGRYRLQMIDIWLNVQRHLQINRESFDGQLCLYGPEEWHIQSRRKGMAQYVLPVPNQVRLPMPTPETAHVSLSTVQSKPGGFA